MEIEILKSCFDEMAIFPYLTTTPEKLGALQIIADALELYPNPTSCITNALTTARLAINGDKTPTQAIAEIRKHIEGLLSELVDRVSKVTTSTMLLITYQDSDNKEYTDILAAGELSIPPEWLTRVVTVETLTEPPQRYIGMGAVEFLKSLSADHEVTK